MPYKHKELLEKTTSYTIPVLAAMLDLRRNKTVYIQLIMVKLYKGDKLEWDWPYDNREFKVTHWMPIPKLEEE